MTNRSKLNGALKMENEIGPGLQGTRLGPRISLSLLLGIAVLAALLVFGDVQAMAHHLRGFPWKWVPAILGFTLLNYGLRFLKWHLYLRWVGTPLPWTASAVIFTAGLAAVLTPGKLGETVKSLLVWRWWGTPISVTLPVVFVERLTDGLAMVLLAGLGISAYPAGLPVLSVIILGLSVLLLAAWIWPQAASFLVRLAGWPILSRILPSMLRFWASAHRLVQPPNLLFAIGLGLISWGAEGLALALILHGLGIPLDLSLAQRAIFILAFATLAGAISFLPGGLGAAEASLVGLLLVQGWPRDVAATATALIRLATLWFGVALGVMAWAWLVPSLGRIAEIRTRPAVLDFPAPSVEKVVGLSKDRPEPEANGDDPQFGSAFS